jgi:hypothetical protein
MTANRPFPRGAAMVLAALIGFVSLWAAAAVNIVMVPISANVKGLSEAIAFTGNATIQTRLVLDNILGNPPVLEIIVDMSDVSGIGASSGALYSVSGPAILHRPLALNDVIRVTFPFYRAGDIQGAATIETAFNCKFDTATGAVTAVKVTTVRM